MPGQTLKQSMFLAAFFLSFTLVLTPSFIEIGEKSPLRVGAQDAEHIFVNSTLAGTIFSAWESPRITLPNLRVLSVETAFIEKTEEILICNEVGDILSFQFQTPNQVIWRQRIRDGEYDSDIIGYDVEAADFTGDGLDEIIVVGPEEGFIEGSVTYYQNLGNRSIDMPGYVLVDYALSVAAGDFDGNGTMDIFGWNWVCEGFIAWNHGDGFLGWDPNVPGSGSFVLDMDGHQSSVAGFQSITAGDIDNDGRDEVLLLGSQTNQHAFIYELHENGTFAFKQEVGYSGPRCHTAMGDVNGDDWLDLIMVNGFTTILYLENLGNGTLNAAQPLPFASASRSSDMALMDIDEDGKDDLIVINEHNEVMLFWTSFIPPEEESTQESGELGITYIAAIVIVIVPTALLAAVRKLKSNGQP